MHRTMRRSGGADHGWIQRRVQRKPRVIVDGVKPPLRGARDRAVTVDSVTEVISTLTKSVQLVFRFGS